jgi:hypothetical protein
LIPFLLLYAAAFGTVAGIGLAQAVAPRRRPLQPALALETTHGRRRQDAE